MKLFVGYRLKPPADYFKGGYANQAHEAQYEGVEFDDGTVVVRWLTATRSTSIWSDFASFESVHGHADYDTTIQWIYASKHYDPFPHPPA